MADGARVLVVDDDAAVRRAVAFLLAREGFRVAEAADGAAALSALVSAPPDAVVLDVMLPRVDGLEVLRRLRTHSRVPVLLLTALGAEHDKLTGFDAGADDYLTKPFGNRELVARVRALLRRGAALGDPAGAVDVGGLTLDAGRRAVRVDGREVALTPAEFALLAVMATRPGEAFGAGELVRAVHGHEAVSGPEASSLVRMLVFRVRRKIEPVPARPVRLVSVGRARYALR